MAVAATAIHAQDFADLKTAAVDYSKASVEPQKACQDLGKFKSKDIVQITATAMPATDASPAYCRVSGLLDPEIAFEVSLPAKMERTLLHDRQRRFCRRPRWIIRPAWRSASRR